MLHLSILNAIGNSKLYVCFVSFDLITLSPNGDLPFDNTKHALCNKQFEILCCENIFLLNLRSIEVITRKCKNRVIWLKHGKTIHSKEWIVKYLPTLLWIFPTFFFRNWKNCSGPGKLLTILRRWRRLCLTVFWYMSLHKSCK